MYRYRYKGETVFTFYVDDKSYTVGGKNTNAPSEVDLPVKVSNESLELIKTSVKSNEDKTNINKGDKIVSR